MEFDISGRRLILGEPTASNMQISRGKSEPSPIQLVSASFEGREYNVRYDSSKNWFIDDVFGLGYRDIEGINTPRTRKEITEEYARNIII